MADRNLLFISFAESDGGHSYLAMRALLNPSAIGHLIFRNTPSEAIEALAAGQSNFAVVPYYNSITQWEGSTVRALATGQFEIFAQICMPTSYVLAAHREHINIALGLYATERGMGNEAFPDFAQIEDWIARRCAKALDDPKYAGLDEARREEERQKLEHKEWETTKEALKTYTRLLTTIYVGAQADEQYRGRLLRPDMNKVDIDLTRNPLRVLEELNRSDLMKSMARSQGPQAQPVYPQNISGGTVPLNFGFGPAPMLKDFKGPAALVAKGLLNAPGNREGWEKEGSVGEIVALLRKLQVLLDVYSFGPPDLPQNKTLYLLIGKKGEKFQPRIVLDQALLDANPPLRVMALMKTSFGRAAKRTWMRPLEFLNRNRNYIWDRPPLMVSPPGKTLYLQEGGKPQAKLFETAGFDTVVKDAKRAINTRPNESSKYEVSFLGVYPTTCHSGCEDWLCCAAAEVEQRRPSLGDIFWAWFKKNQALVLPLLLLLLLLGGLAYAFLTWQSACEDSNSDSLWCTGHVDWDKYFPPPPPQPATQPPPEPSGPPPQASAEPPPVTTPAPAPVPPPQVHVPVQGPPPYVPPPAPKSSLIAFYEGKANLTTPALNLLRDGAMRALETEQVVHMRLDALGPPENDPELWARRLQGVKDELVRLGVPADRIIYEGQGPYEVIIRQRAVPTTRSGREHITMELIPDPMAGSDGE